MDAKRRFFLIAWVIFLVSLFVCGEMVMAEDHVVRNVKVVISRGANGCIDKCQFKNDRARCGNNPRCGDVPIETPAETINCLKPDDVPKIGGEPVRWAGDLKKYEGYESQKCEDFGILTYGTPGWLWLYIGGSWQLVCVGGYYYAPYQLCCDQTQCIPKP